MNHLKIKNLIPAPFLSLFLYKCRIRFCSLGKRCHVLQLSPAIQKNHRKVAIVIQANNKRKDCVLSPIHICAEKSRSVLNRIHIRARFFRRTPFLTACSALRKRGKTAASLTVEAALELPVFFVLIAIVLQYASVMRAATQFSGLLTTTAQEMAIAAYKEEYSDANNILRGVLSDAWAATQVISKAEDKDAVRLASFLNSSYLKEGDLIKLVLSYQPKPKYSLISLPFTFFVQKAAVRGWTGKEGHSGNNNSKETANAKNKTVYVTEHGSVYHTNPDCSHLKVTVIPVSKKQRDKARNVSGGKYKKCPYCGKNSTGSYYVNPYGDCWHTRVDCPALKRTVHEADLDDCSHLHECKDCRNARKG